MSDKKISQLPASAGTDTTAQIAAAEGGSNTKWTVAQIAAHGGGGTPSGIQYADKQLSNSEILNLPLTAINLVPAAGTGSLLFVHRVYGVLDTTNGAYTFKNAPPNTGVTVTIKGATPYSVSQYLEDQMNALQSTGVALIDFAPIFQVQGGTLVQAVWFGFGSDDNNPITIEADNGGDAFGGGHSSNTLSLRIWYSIVPTAPFS